MVIMRQEYHSDPSVLYLDADTEITEAIEKLKNTSEDEVRIVVPSRSGLLQSLVNIKLLQKASKDAKKVLVLVTNDQVTKNLAGTIGVAVASSVKAMAHVPKSSPEEKIPDKLQVVKPEDTKSSSQPDKASNPPAEGFTPKHISLGVDGDKESKKSIQNEEISSGTAQDKRVPNYNRLNKRIWWVASGLVVVIGLVIAYILVPTGRVNILTKAKKTSLSFNFILDTTASSSDHSAQVLASRRLEVDKDINLEITATGKKEVGTKALGTVKLSNASNSNPIAVPAGTVLTAGGRNYTLDQAVTIPGATVSGGIVAGTANGNITASEPGESYNIGNTGLAVTGFGSGANTVTASGSASGGTSRTITILSAEDIAGARQQVEQQGASAKDELTKKTGPDQMLFGKTIQGDIVQFNSSVQEGNEANKVTITAKVRYGGFVANNDDINKLFEQHIQNELKGNKQIYQNGAKEGQYSIIKQFSAQRVQLGVETQAFYGDPIDIQQIAKDVSGKPKKEVADIVKKHGEQITGAQVETWPEFIPNMPLLASKIKIEIQVSTN